MSWLERRLGGHYSIGRITIYGFNAVHGAVYIWTKRWGYICLHPPMYMFGTWWPWYVYASPNATPWAATFAIGPGVSADNRRAAPRRRRQFGHNFSTEHHYDALRRLNDQLDD